MTALICGNRIPIAFLGAFTARPPSNLIKIHKLGRSPFVRNFPDRSTTLTPIRKC
ncbi:MAG: hypothetical protein ACMG55_03220 [Microcoleus sp.]